MKKNATTMYLFSSGNLLQFGIDGYSHNMNSYHATLPLVTVIIFYRSMNGNLTYRKHIGACKLHRLTSQLLIKYVHS
jgi:hypothetical protein